MHDGRFRILRTAFLLKKWGPVFNSWNEYYGTGPFKVALAKVPKPLPRPSSESGYVYIMRCGKYHKIGKTADLQQRLLAMNTHNPEPVELVASFQCEHRHRLETDLHKRFKFKRKNGEWFDLSHSDLQEIFNVAEAYLTN